ncbi:MAG: hypothetical protein WKF84_11010 [Pyrinomonadaceae bacterium]
MSEKSTGGDAAAQARSLSATIPVHLKINGTNYNLQIEPRVSLLDALREFIGLAGTKKGCNQGALRSLHGFG